MLPLRIHISILRCVHHGAEAYGLNATFPATNMRGLQGKPILFTEFLFHMVVGIIWLPKKYECKHLPEISYFLNVSNQKYERICYVNKDIDNLHTKRFYCN